MVEVFYDGKCSFCQRVVQALKRKDKKNILSFTPIQGSDLPKKYVQAKMFIVRDSNVFLKKSDAYLYIYWKLGGRHRLYAFFARLVPRFIRDATYGLISSRRHRL